MKNHRTSPKKLAKRLAKHLRGEHPDYAYLKKLFYYLRFELGVEVEIKEKKFPVVPTEEEIQRFYAVVWQSNRFQDILIIKTFLYTGVRVSELCNIRLSDVDTKLCQIRINRGKGNKSRLVVFPSSFREALAMHIKSIQHKRGSYLFESSWKRKYSERGIRQMLRRYADRASLSQCISPHKLRHFLLLWLKKQGIDDAFIQPYSGHAHRQSLEVYSRLAISDAQQQYDQVIARFPV